MNRKRLACVLSSVSGIILISTFCGWTAEGPTIPPTVDRIWPVGMKRGTTATFTIDGRNLTNPRPVLFDTKGITAKVISLTDISEPKREIRLNVDTKAAVPEGKKQQAKVEVTASPDVEPGIHWFRLQTPLGTSNAVALDLSALSEIPAQKRSDSGMPLQQVDLPATLIGTIQEPGEVHSYQFKGRASEELVFQVLAAPLGSALKSALILRDATGKEVARAGYGRKGDAVLTYKLPSDSMYTLSITDRERGGGMTHYYRLNAGALPYVTGVFPLGLRAGQASTVKVSGVNLASNGELRVQPPAVADGWTTVPVEMKTPRGSPLNKLELAVGNEPEASEVEPNNNRSEAQRLTLPVTINGRIDGHIRGEKSTSVAEQAADEDYFRFSARKGRHVTIEVAAARLGSPLDSVVEILDSQGHAVPRATIRCLYQTSLTLNDRDSRLPKYRLVSTAGFHENDYLMVGDELNQISFIDEQPDADIDVKGYGGLRMAFLGTSPEAHTVNEPVYKAQVLPPDAQFPPNGLPVFHISYRNDDGGPGYGRDSRLEFEVPKDGDYIVHLKDVTGHEGPEFAYRLTIRDFSPDFTLDAMPASPNVPRGGGVPITVSVNRGSGYQGPVEIEVKGLPRWITTQPAIIPAGQDSTTVVLQAASDAPLNVDPTPFQIVGRANVGARTLVRTANRTEPLQVASVMPAPDVILALQPREVVLEPGKTAKVTLRVSRENGFAGRVPCFVRNLPPGVRVVNLGLNGVLVPEGQTSQTFTLKAEDWARSLEQPIYVVAEVESNSTTTHASAPIVLKLNGKQMANAARYPR